MLTWRNHHLNVQDAGLWAILDMDTYNTIGIFRLTKRRSNHALGHTDQLTGSADPHEGYSCRHHLVGYGHGAKLLSPAMNYGIGHMLASLIDEDSVTQRTGKLYGRLYDLCTRAGARIEDNNGRR